MAQNIFDKFFLNLPPLYRENDFDSFWNKSITAIKKVPIEPLLKKNIKKSSSKFAVYETNYNGFTKTKISGTILIPKKKVKPNIIIHIHDYNNIFDYNPQILDDRVAYFFLNLRGHEYIPTMTDEENETPGYMIENILDRDTYYVKAVYLDVYRSIDMLRLVPELNCSSIGIIGNGFGAAAALFTAVNSERIKAMVLDAPSFSYLPLSQNIATNDASNEINTFISSTKGKKKEIKKNLSYFDALNFSDKVTCPVLTITGFKDTMSPPECVFSLFNHFLTEKAMEIYPDDGPEAGGETQIKKSIQWLIERISDKN